ncbi:PREDICTED: uncharacterized protein LOC105622991 [Atta cephalotes]|uniref:Uncharacterized protein n=1 Tax=Atta cephalotes TaxID=12957 RepID=A0A158NQH5_ATTCE|nr:PREDICTED: uncharacterized protein LOC105622991 [Atta cephalotes]
MTNELSFIEIEGRFAERINTVFTLMIFVQFSISSTVLCLSIYKMLTKNLLSLDFAYNLSYLGCMLMQIYLYCWFGNEVTLKINVRRENNRDRRNASIPSQIYSEPIPGRELNPVRIVEEARHMQQHHSLLAKQNNESCLISYKSNLFENACANLIPGDMATHQLSISCENGEIANNQPVANAEIEAEIGRLRNTIGE